MIASKANFNLEDVSPIKFVNKIKIPIIFIVGRKDKLIKESHTRKLFYRYKG